MRRLVCVVALVTSVAACGPAAPAAPSRSVIVTVPPSASATAGTVATAPSSGSQASRIETVAEADGLKLVAAFDRLEVDPGGTVTVDLSIQNTRATDVVFDEPCNDQAMTVELPAPVEPVGRDWDGIAAAFKTFALEQSSGSPMESSVRTPLRTAAKAQPCHAASGMDTTGRPATIIPTGDTYETVLTWTADLVSGLPATPGVAPFSIRTFYDLEPMATGLVQARTLEAPGTITVTNEAPAAEKALSAGLALDAALGDPQFAAWLAKQPRDAWVNANLFLQPRAFDVPVLPEVPYWDVELYREPRNWAILYVDAVTGEVLGRTFCDTPCDR